MEVLLWFLWLCSAPVLSLETDKELLYEPRPRTWDEAQQFCRSEYGGELATRETSSDIAKLKAMDLSSFHACLGLKKRDSGWVRWDLWYEYEENLTEDLFAEGEPQSGHECGKMIHNHTKVYTDDCEQRHFFICERKDGTNQFYFIAETKPWAEALEHCQHLDLQLMDFTSFSHSAWKNSPVYPLREFRVWIGERYNGAGSGYCLSITSYYKTTRIKNCSLAFPFICQRLSLVLVKERLSWDHGLEVCRNISVLDRQGDFGLLSVEEKDLQDVLKHTTGATTSKVWLGLRFLAGSWFWSDGAVVSLPSLLSCPEARLRCGALVLNTSSIEPADCSLELNVLCHRRQ